MLTTANLLAAAEHLIGGEAGANPEYARGIVELIADVIPGDTDTAQAYVMGVLEIDPSVFDVKR